MTLTRLSTPGPRLCFLSLIRGLVVLVFCFAHPSTRAQDSPLSIAAPELQPIRSEEELLQTLHDDDSLAAHIERLSAEIDALQQEIKPPAQEPPQEPTQQEQARIDSARSLSETLAGYLALLKEFQSLKAQLKDLGDSQKGGQFADELARTTEKIEQARRRTTAWQHSVSDEDLQEVQQQLESAQSDLAARMQGQTERQDNLARLAEKKAAIQDAIRQTKARFFETETEQLARLQSASNDIERHIAAHSLRQAGVQAADAVVRFEKLELEAERDRRLDAQADQRLPLLKELVERLQALLDKLQRIRTRSEIDQAADWVDQIKSNPQAFSEYERIHWPLLLQILKASKELNEFVQSRGIQRFSQEELLEHEENIKTESEIWRQFLDSLRRRRGVQIKERFRQLGRDILDWTRIRDGLRARYDSTFDDRSVVLANMDASTDQIRSGYRAISNLKPAAPPSGEQAALVEQLKGKRDKFSQDSAAVLADLKSNAERLSTAIQRVDDHLRELAADRNRLYWSYLTVVEAPLWKFQLSRAIEEWDAEQHARAEGRQRISQGVRSVSRTQWIIFAIGITLTLSFAQVLRSKLVRRAERLEQEIARRLQEDESSFATLSDRLHVTGLRLIARTSLAILPAALLWSFLATTPLDGRIARAVLLFICSAALADALIRACFRQTKARFRLIPCSNVVAGFYRRRLRVLFWALLLLLPLPMLLTELDWSFYTRQYMWAALKALVLLGLFVFLLNKNMVLRITGRRDAPSPSLLASLIHHAYPLFLIFALAVLTLQILGYNALATYVIGGATASLATVLAARLLSRYLAELSETIRVRAAQSAQVSEIPAAPPTAPGADPPTPSETIIKDEPGEYRELLFLAGLLLLLGRWIVHIGAVLLVLRYWGVDAHQLVQWMDQVIIPASQADASPVTVGRVLLAVLVFAGGVVVSRGVRAILQSKIDAARSPLDRGSRIAVTRLIHYFILCLGLYFALYVMRIPLGAITVLLGTLGLGIGLGLQPVFMNFISGLIMLLERHLKVGDMVEIDGVLGEVTNLSIRSTTIKTFDNVDLIVPNAEFINSKVVNWTLKDSRIRGHIDVGVAYGSDVRLVRRLLLQVATENPLVLREPPPAVGFDAFGASSLDFRLYAWFNNVHDRGDFMTDAKYRILELFEENGINIPSPQRTLTTLDSAPLRVQIEQPFHAHEKIADD